jgi:hypothetical protein
MSIETTYTVRRQDAMDMLFLKDVPVYPNDSNYRLEQELYKHKDSIFENYKVVNNDYEFEKDEPRKSTW